MRRICELRIIDKFTLLRFQVHHNQPVWHPEKLAPPVYFQALVGCLKPTNDPETLSFTMLSLFALITLLTTLYHCLYYLDCFTLLKEQHVWSIGHTYILFGKARALIRYCCIIKNIVV